MDIPARSSYIRRKDMDSVLNCLVSDNLAPGEFLDRLIKQAKERLGFDYGVGLRSPIGALELALACLGLEAGSSVALSALAPAWAYKAIQNRGLKALWLDADAEDPCLGADARDRIAAGQAKALFLSEPWGIVPDPARLESLGLPVIEDASSSLGASVSGPQGSMAAGSLGLFSIVGLEDASSITAGGGALLYANARREGQVLRNGAEGLLPEERLSDLNAALALSQLKDMDRFLEKRRELYSVYEQSLARSHKKALAQGAEGEPARFGCVVVLETGVKDVRAYARKKDVDTVMAFEDSCVGRALVPEGACPQAASLLNRAVAFPLHPRIGKSAAQKIAKVLATLP